MAKSRPGNADSVEHAEAKMYVLDALDAIPELGIEATDRIIVTPSEGNISVLYSLPIATAAVVVRAFETGGLRMLTDHDTPLPPTAAELRSALGLDRSPRRPRPTAGPLRLISGARVAQVAKSYRRQPRTGGDAA